MNNRIGIAPSLKNSKAVNQGEIQSAQQDMNSAGTAGMTSGMTMGGATMTTGGAANLSSSTAVGQAELQKAKQKVQNSGVQNNTTLS